MWNTYISLSTLSITFSERAQNQMTFYILAQNILLEYYHHPQLLSMFNGYFPVSFHLAEQFNLLFSTIPTAEQVGNVLVQSLSGFLNKHSKDMRISADRVPLLVVTTKDAYQEILFASWMSGCPRRWASLPWPSTRI